MRTMMPGNNGKSTRVSGYVETPVRKACATCEYLTDGNTCQNSVVRKDPEVPGSANGLKRVNPDNGCCNEWEAKPELRGAAYGGGYPGRENIRPEDLSDAELEALLRAKGILR